MEFLILFLAGVIQGAANFGFALIALPFLGLMMPLKTAVPLLTLMGLFLLTAQLFQIRTKPDFKMVGILLASGMLGVPFGTWILLTVGDDLLKCVVGVLLVAAAVLLAKGFRMRRGGKLMHMVVGGFLSGLCKGAASIGGPPIVILLSNYDLDKQSYRANSLIFFFLIGIFAIPNYLRAGLFSQELLIWAIYGFGVAYAGVMAGNAVFKRMDESKFKRLTYGIVMLSGVITVASVLG